MMLLNNSAVGPQNVRNSQSPILNSNMSGGQAAQGGGGMRAAGAGGTTNINLHMKNNYVHNSAK